jgi:hypothetical protein
MAKSNQLKMLLFKLPTGQIWRSVSVSLLAVLQPFVHSFAIGSAPMQIHHILLASQRTLMGVQPGRADSDRCP